MSSSRPERPALTEQQRAAVQVPSASVALSAGAGCGKTSVLTERFLSHLEGPARAGLRGLVALTFTDKAARELRERVREACQLRLASRDDPAHWREITRGLEAAPIGTFHAFCARILRRHAIAAGVDPGFAILDPALAPTLSDQALGACLRHWLAERNADLNELGVELGLNTVRLCLADLIENHAAEDLAEWMDRAPEEVVAGWQTFWREQLQPRLIEEFVNSPEVQSALGLLSRHECENPRMRERHEFLREAVPRLAGEADPVALLEAIVQQGRVKGAGTEQAWETGEAYKAVKQSLDKLRAAAYELIKQLTITAADETLARAMAVLGARFARLASEAQRAYDRVKQDRGMLDYDDLLRETRTLLRSHADLVRRELAADQGAILVDEFQDTDPIQGQILELLAGPDLHAGRLFLVGDQKQSIYRFRGARPALFAEFAQRFPDDGRRSLNENFRSAPGIIDFVNLLFAETFVGDEHTLRESPRTPPRAKEPVVEFLWAHEPDPGGAPMLVDARRAVEARWIARRLAFGLQDGWTVRDRDTHATRAATPGDIALLFRSLKDLATYEQALNLAGLETYVVGGTSFYYQQEVQDLANLLSVLEDPLDEVALAGLLRSPFYSVSDEGLFWLAMQPGAGFVAGFAGSQSIAQLRRLDRQRLARAQAQLASWRAEKDRLPIAALVERALDQSGYEASLLAEPLGARRWANVRKLVRLARRFDAQGGLALPDFVARLRADLRRPPREEQAATTDEGGNCVQLMSIHQAKGLEFPIVVVPDLDRRPPHTPPRVAFHPELGMVVRPPSDGDADRSGSPGDDDASPATDDAKGLGCRAFDTLERFEDAEEALRLFYVAITRARDFVILSAGLPAAAKPNSQAMKLLDRRFDRATGVCRSQDAGAGSDRLVRVWTECPPALVSAAEARRERPRPVTVARTIELALSRPPAERPAEPPSRARWMSLDPALWLGHSAAQVDRLLRAVLSEPKLSAVSGIEAIVARAGRLQSPAASSAIVAEAVARLRAWLASKLAQRIARAAEVHRAVAWSVPWPGAGPDSTVFHGQLDFAVRDAQGGWELVNLALPGVPEPVERLRILLSARAVSALGIQAVNRAWTVSLGPEPLLRGEEAFDDAAIEAAIACALAPEAHRLASQPGEAQTAATLTQ